MPRKPTPTGPLLVPFVVLIDQREKHPYAFAGLLADADRQYRPLSIATETVHLQTGDYSILGAAPLVAVERKSLADLFGTLGQGRERFTRELARLAAMPYAAVVVEAEWSEILDYPPEHSQLDPKTIFRSVLAWQQRYPSVHWWFVPGRNAGEVTTYRILERWWKEQERKAREHRAAKQAQEAAAHDRS